MTKIINNKDVSHKIIYKPNNYIKINISKVRDPNYIKIYLKDDNIIFEDLFNIHLTLQIEVFKNLCRKRNDFKIDTYDLNELKSFYININSKQQQISFYLKYRSKYIIQRYKYFYRYYLYTAKLSIFDLFKNFNMLELYQKYMLENL